MTSIQNISHRRGRAGSTVIVGLVIMALATLGLTAWIGLISARSYYVEGMQVSMKRRVAQMNARAVTSQHLHINALTKEATSATTLTLPDGTGSVSVPEMTDAPFSSTVLAGAVRTGPGNGFSYAVEVPVTTTITIDDDGDATTDKIETTHTTDYWLRSRSQLLAGDLVSMHLPGYYAPEVNQLNGQLRVQGNIQQWGALPSHNVTNAPRAISFSTPTVGDASLTTTDRVRDLAAAWKPQWNFASMPVTSGDFSGSANAYKGYIDIVNSGRPWSLVNKVLTESHDVLSGATALNPGRGAESHGNGTVDVTLDNVLGTNLLIGNGTTTLNLFGQTDDDSYNAAAAQRAIMIVVNQTSNSNRLTRINFHGRNNRPLMLAVRRAHNTSWVDFVFKDTSTSDPLEWRMLWVNENARMRMRTFHASRPDGQQDGTVVLTGGVLTDRRFVFSNSTNRQLHIYRDMNPALLERFAPRVGWLEAYRD